MDESEKHPQIGTIASDLKTLFPVISTRRRTKLFVYGFVVAFVACTAFLAFGSSGNASPWFNTLFTSSSYSSSSISATIAPYKSQFSSIVSYLFPNSSETLISPAQKPNNQSETRVGSPKDGILEGIGSPGNGASEKNPTGKIVGSPGNGVSEKNRTETGVGSKKDGILAGKNQTVTGNGSHGIEVSSKGKPEGGSVGKNQTGSGISFHGSGVPPSNQKDPKASSNHKDGVLAKNETTEGATLNPKKSEAPAGEPKGVKAGDLAALASKADDRKREEWIDKMMGCDLFQGQWMRDESYPLYQEGSCPHIDEPFDCYRNGRPDRVYQKLRWQPNGCNIPRLNGTDMLERLRGKRLVFVGDSLNRNMWESLVCVLRNSVKDKKKVFEASGKSEFKTQGSYSFLFKDYGCTVEFYRSPFLVQEWEMPGNNGTKKETLRLDIFQSSASKYKDAHVIIFNTGHWWTHDKTSKGRDYYQEGNRVYSELNVAEAFHKALNTWAKWVDTNVNPKKSLVFFRGYSASHFSGGRWNSGGQCDRETEPIKNETYLSSYPPKMGILESVIKGMKTPVSYLNITRMTDYRKDAHPSIYRKQKLSEEEKRSPERYQDCSHWCLPGVPDSWNELLYAQILIKQHQMRR